jgi:hypothetical protein
MSATPETSSKPILYACSGCSDSGELADRIARRLSREGVGKMSCLAGVGGQVKHLVAVAKQAERVLVIVLLLVLFGLTVAGKASDAHAAPPSLSKQPYLQLPGEDTMTVMWESSTHHSGTVWFGRDGKLNQHCGPVVPRNVSEVSVQRQTNWVTFLTNGLVTTRTNITKRSVTNTFFVYQATLSHLRPGTIYTYLVETDGRRTEPRAFKTFSAEPHATRFIAYGDSRSNPGIHRRLAQQFSQYAPEFVLHSGDLVMAGQNYRLWSSEFFEPVAGVADRIPILPVPGNHEEDLENYLTYFPRRGGRRWSSFDAGPVHVLALDYHFESATNEQFEFAREDLRKSTAPWKIVFLHYPVFNYGHHNSGWGHRSYLPLFHETKVDLILAGHTHLYERIRPVAPTNQPGAWAVACLTTGGGGAELHQPYPHPAQAAAVSTNHFIAFTATRDTLRARAIRLDGVEFDSFEIHKPGGEQTTDYLAQVYPEELLKISYEVGPALLGKLAALPTNQQPARAMLTLPPLETAIQPVELEISLAPESARHYTLEERSLRVTTPPPGGTKKVFWFNVRATGNRKIKGPELNPPLVFKARATTLWGEMLAYGPPSRLSQTAAATAGKLVKPTASTAIQHEAETSTPRNQPTLVEHHRDG